LFDIGTCFASSPHSLQTYRLGSNDVLHIQVFGEDDLNVERKIDGDGNIHYPLLGVFPVGGKTVQEVQEELTARLQKGYIRKPKVAVYVVRHRNFYVSGEVRAAGGYPYEEGLTVHKALSMAGGWTEKAERGNIKVNRVINGVTESIEVAFDDPVLPDDFIVVPQIRKVYVNGEVKRAGDYPYERDLTVHKVITMAGGFTDKAAESRTKVLRKVNGKEQSIPVDLETIVLPDDILVVPRSFF
jgi:polysaccharide export outer membrane protein